MSQVSNVVVNWEAAFPNFTKREMTCRCGCGLLPSIEFMMWLQKLRNIAGFPFIITSGARCPEYNSKVSTSGFNGPHTHLKAVDIRVYGSRGHRLEKLAFAHGAQGLGRQQSSRVPHNSRFIHLDIIEPGETHMPRPWIWSY